VLTQRDGFPLQFPGEATEVAEDIGGQRGFRTPLGAQGVAGLLGDDAGKFLGPSLHRLGDAQQ
jgi:hypothetical protein